MNDHLSFAKYAYEKYKLDWMISHSYTLYDLAIVLEYMRDEMPHEKISSILREWEDHEGFDGEIWACFDEFFETEYQDADYMRSILTLGEYSTYLKYREVQDEALGR